MSQIFYSQVDSNLQQELNRRAAAGKTDRSETALRYMTEKIANVEIVAYEGNRRDKNKEVHRLGGTAVREGEYLPGGPDGFLTSRPYTLKEARWVTNERLNKLSGASHFVEQQVTSNLMNNDSYRIPPFITSAELAINDNSRGLTNRATINITIPNPDRDLNFMESIYARPGRYCMLTIAHPETALMTRDEAGVNGMLDINSLPPVDQIKKQYPEAAEQLDELRKMNQVQFEGLITSFEYQYNADGTVGFTIYILGTSMVYTDLSMIMQTGTADRTDPADGNFTIDQAKSFYQALFDEVASLYQKKNNDPNAKIKWAFGVSPDAAESAGVPPNLPSQWMSSYTGLNGNVWAHVNLNYLINFLNRKILSKLNDAVNQPIIYCSIDDDVYSNYYQNLCSADPEMIFLLDHNAAADATSSPDCYGEIESAGKRVGRRWFPDADIINNPDIAPSTFYISDPQRPVLQGAPGHIFINLKIVEQVVTALSAKKDEFTVKNFLNQISDRINSATGGAINLKLTADPVLTNKLYFRDVNWVFSPNRPKPQPYQIPMFANHPIGTIVRDFKLSAKLPSNVQSLMYSINSSDKVSEDQIAPYMNFMYNNASVSRSGSIETSTFGPNKELTEKLSKQYRETHEKYLKQLTEARAAYGSDPTNAQKQIALQAALAKYIQYPTPTIEQTNKLAAPVFPIDAEFTIDGVNGFRYGDIVDFPGIPQKYRTQTTFTIKGITHSVTTNGEWTTKISCMMRPKFD